jgi:RNA polymerase sigma factor (sigma-70 family)
MVVLASGSDRDSERALQELCESYWFPLYAFARRSGLSVQEAQDMTQEFLSRMLKSGKLLTADRSRGKFRTYLLGCMKRMLIDEWRKSNRIKRGAGAPTFSLEEMDPESAYLREASHNLTPDKLFDKRWAETLVDRSVSRLRAEWEVSGKPFAKLKCYLMEQKGAVPFAELAGKMGVSESALKTSVFRLRKRYGEIIREEVSHTVSDPSEVEDEIRHLLTALSV